MLGILSFTCSTLIELYRYFVFPAPWVSMNSRISLQTSKRNRVVHSVAFHEYDLVRSFVTEQFGQVTALAVQITQARAAAVCWVSSGGVHLMAHSGFDQPIEARSIPKDTKIFAPNQVTFISDPSHLQIIQHFLGVTGFDSVVCIPIESFDHKTLGSVLVFTQVNQAAILSEQIESLERIIALTMDGIHLARDERKKVTAGSGLETSVLQAKEGVIEFDTNFGIVAWNMGAEEMYGFSSREMLGQSMMQLIPTEHQAVFAEQIKNLKTGLFITPRETIRIHRSGVKIHVRSSLNLIRNAKQEITGFLEFSGVLAELTPATEEAQVEAEAGFTLRQLLQTQNQFSHQKVLMELVLNTIEQGVTVTNAEGYFEYVNPAVEAMFGYQAADLIGKQPHSFIYPDDLERLLKERDDRIQGWQNISQFRAYRADGSLAHFEAIAYPRFDARQQFAGTISLLRDVTLESEFAEEIQKIETKLEQQRELGLQVINSISQGFISVDKAGLVVYANQVAVDLTGATDVSQLIGSNLLKLVPLPELKQIKVQLGLVLQGQMRTYRHRLIGYDGLERQVEVSIYPKFDPQKQFISAILIITDMTQIMAQQRHATIADKIAQTVHQGLAVLDRTGKFEFVNPALAQMLEQAPEQLSGTFCETIVAPSETPKIMAFMQSQEFLLTKTFFIRLCTASGRELPVEIGYYPNLTNQDFDGAIVVVTNLSEQIARELEVMRASTAILEMEKQLRIQEQKALLIAETIGQGIAVGGPQGQIEFANAAYLRMLGYKDLAELNSVPVHELVYPDDRPILVRALEQRSVGLSTTYTIRLVKSNGQTLEVEMTGYPRLVGEEFLGSITVVSDLTERTKREKALLESNLHYQHLLQESQFQAKRLQLIEQVRSMVSGASSSRELMIGVAEALHSVFGYPMVAIGLIENEILVLQHLIGYSQPIADVSMTGNGVVVRCARENRIIIVGDASTDPDFIYIEPEIRSELCVPIVIAGQVVGVIDLEATRINAFDEIDAQLILEISERISSKLESTKALDRLRILENAVQSSKELIMITDAQLELPGPRIMFTNQALLHHTGYSEQELIGQSPRIFQGAQSDRAVLAELKSNLKKGKDSRGKTLNYRKDGSSYMVEWHISPVRDQNGIVTQFISLQRELTNTEPLEPVVEVQDSPFLMLPTLEAALNFIRGVGGEQFFAARLEVQPNHPEPQLVLRGRGFVVIVKNGSLDQLPKGIRIT